MPKMIASISDECVACGACASSCKNGAIAIYRGLMAIVAEASCAGCGRCVAICPAAVIAMANGEVE
jgi:MinD superfamily P-loop ATPase